MQTISQVRIIWLAIWLIMSIVFIKFGYFNQKMDSNDDYMKKALFLIEWLSDTNTKVFLRLSGAKLKKCLVFVLKASLTLMYPKTRIQLSQHWHHCAFNSSCPLKMFPLNTVDDRNPNIQIPKKCRNPNATKFRFQMLRLHDRC